MTKYQSKMKIIKIKLDLYSILAVY